MKKFAHIQMSKEANAMIYVIEVSEVNNFLDELVAKGEDISKSFLLKIS